MKPITRIFMLSLLLMTAFLLPIEPSFAKSDNPGIKVLNSRINAVTVYSDRAQVTRIASETLPAGEHRLMFDNLPMGLETGSIQINGTGNAVLSDIKTNIERYAETPDKDMKALVDEKTMLEDRIAELGVKVSQAQNEKGFLENITKKLTGVTEKTPAGELDPEKWVKMVDFYRNRNMALDKDIYDTEIAKRDVKSRLDKVNRQIADIGSSEQNTRYQVEALVRMKEAGELSLRLSYIVHGPSWRPIYDLRVSTREKKMNLTYNAVVRQNTTEPWDDVALELSTAQPVIGGQQPELSPWFVNVYEPQLNYDSKRAGRAAPMPAAAANQMIFKVKESVPSPEKAEAPVEESEMEKPTAAVQTNATSVVFEIKGKSTIASDNLPHKVTVLIQDFPAEFRYSAAPKLSPHAYLKTKAKNASDFPLLPGATNVFLDNNFVSNASLNQVAPGEDFWTFLGVDGAIKVERKFLRRHQEQEGVFEKKTKVVYEYLTEITNNKKSEEELVVWDQVPISSHQDIVVKLVEPQFDKDTPTIKKNELNYIEWFFKVKAGEKIKIPMVYTVEYPEGKQVTGLE
jgi:uncharacterized protein (TIGR02231 family)